jgi:hypothetical protein
MIFAAVWKNKCPKIPTNYMETYTQHPLDYLLLLSGLSPIDEGE